MALTTGVTRLNGGAVYVWYFAPGTDAPRRIAIEPFARGGSSDARWDVHFSERMRALIGPHCPVLYSQVFESEVAAPVSVPVAGLRLENSLQWVLFCGFPSDDGVVAAGLNAGAKTYLSGLPTPWIEGGVSTEFLGGFVLALAQQAYVPGIPSSTAADDDEAYEEAPPPAEYVTVYRDVPETDDWQWTHRVYREPALDEHPASHEWVGARKWRCHGKLDHNDFLHRQPVHVHHGAVPEFAFAREHVSTDDI